jgi:microcystin-dependent protein
MPETTTLGSAVPGTIVASGSLITPAGDQGPAGSAGSAGSAGPPGAAGLNAFNITSGGFTVPPVGSTVTVTLNDASWVVVGQMIYCDSAGGGAGQAGALQVTAKTGNQITLLTPAPTPAIPPADATQAGLLKQLSGKTTDFIDGTNACQDLSTAIRPIGGAPPGAIMDYAGASAPTGWLLCNGAAVSRTTYAALFAAISTAFGAGDGSTTFNVPDTRGRISVGGGQGTGLTNRTLAATGGEETHQLSVAELASHTHVQNPHTHGIYVGGGATGANILSYVTTGQFDNSGNNLQNATAVNQNTGSGTAHNTMPPFIVFNKIIKT